MKDDSFDSLNRRKRFAPPLSSGKRITPVDADYLIFEWLDDHGPLPTTYLYAATKHLRCNYTGLQKRLRDLRNEADTLHGGRYLVRPAQQKDTIRAREQPLTYDNLPVSRDALRARGLIPNAQRFDPMHHRFMNACCTASMRLAAPLAGLEFVTLKTILARNTCPKSTREAKNPLAIRSVVGALVPDDLNGLAYPTSPTRSFRFLAWEQDRATETLNAIEAKLLSYLDVLRSRSYEGHWGITSLYVLIVTTRSARMRNMIDLLARLTVHEPKLREFFLFKHKPEFAEEWVTPPIMYDLLTDPWERAGLAPFFLDRT